MSAFPRVRPKIEGHIRPRIDSEMGGRYLAIPLDPPVRAFTTVHGTGCGTPSSWRPRRGWARGPESRQGCGNRSGRRDGPTSKLSAPTR